jgi:hypothetical protein
MHVINEAMDTKCEWSCFELHHRLELQLIGGCRLFIEVKCSMYVLG